MIPFRAGLEEYQREAEQLLEKLRASDEAVQWRFKWEHPRFRGRSVEDVRAAALDLADAQTVIAQEHAFTTWADLIGFTDAVQRDAAVALFETAVEAVISGDVAGLSTMLREHPELVRSRSMRRHHATLLHYLGANGVEGGRQRTPRNAVEVAKLLLDAGAEVDALADLYDERCTTMSMLVSSSPPHEAGLQVALAETLLDYGAALEGTGSKWQSALMTALVFGYPETAKMFARRGAPVDDLPRAAGLGRLEDARRLLPDADRADRHVALALAAQLGHADVVRMLLDAGEDPNRLNPDGFHSHATPLHHAVAGNHAEVVRLLVERGTRLNVRDTIYQGTPLDWAVHCQRPEIAEYLRSSA
jgi:ankyrin repeat protein